jgi:hypothetical protein
MATDCTNTKIEVAPALSESVQMPPSDAEPQACNHDADTVSAGFLFCLRCGTPMVGHAECPQCDFPRRTRCSKADLK